MMVPKGRANYEPNSLGDHGEETGPRECPAHGFTTFPSADKPNEQGDKLRVRPASFADHYSQARLFYRSLDPAEQAHVAFALVFELSKVDVPAIRTRMLGNLVNVDPDLAKHVAGGLAMPVPAANPAAAKPVDLDPSPALRIIRGKRELHTLKGRQVGILVADGSDASIIRGLKEAVLEAGGKALVVAPKIGGVTLSNGKTLVPDKQLAGFPSVFCDAIAVVLSDKGCATLLKEGAAVQFVMDAFGHLKCIGADDGAQPLLDKAGVVADDGVVKLNKSFAKAAARRYWDREPSVRNLP
jgi:catalase